MSNLPKTEEGFNAVLTAKGTQAHLTKVLGEKKNSFVSNITALVSSNTDLQKCEPKSVIYAGIKATALDLPLDPSLGLAYVVPYKNQAQFQIGYKGLIELAQRSGQYATINAREVREGEIINEDFITGALTFKRAENRETLAIIGYVAYIELLNGFKKMFYMTRGEIEAHGKKFSKTFNFKGSAWQTNFDSMAEKTVLKLLIGKYGPKSIEMQEAIKYDQAVVTEAGPQYIDNEPVVDEEQKQKAVDIFSQVISTEIDENVDVITDDIAADIELPYE